MTVTVGTDVYLSVTNADTYWSNRNNSTWSAATTAQKEKALREATQYIDGAYEFIGTQKTDVVLAWPRYDVYIRQGNFAGVSYDSDTIPPQIKDACAELALECLSDRLVEVKERGGMVKREKVDVVEIEYMDWAPSQKAYNFVSMILKPLLLGNKNTRNLVRT
jgi:hypothetical protein